jgi:ChrR-like protein with cupin domain
MRNFMKTLALTGVLIAGLAAAPTLYARAPQSPQGPDGSMSLTPAELTWTAGPTMLPPGASMAVIEGSFNRPGPFVVRLKFPANYRIPPHWHPAKVTVTVISGTFNMAHGDKLDATKGKVLPAGSIFEMPATIHHYGWASEETIIQHHGMGPFGINYVSPADDPRKK